MHENINHKLTNIAEPRIYFDPLCWAGTPFYIEDIVKSIPEITRYTVLCIVSLYHSVNILGSYHSLIEWYDSYTSDCYDEWSLRQAQKQQSIHSPIDRG